MPGEPSRSFAVYELLARDIKALGVECAFGLISDDVCQLIATLDALGVRFYGARHESNAIAMAEGYAAASGRLGIAIIGRGPALANGMHGLTAASRAGSPVLVISGDAPRASGVTNGTGPDLKAFAAAGIIAAGNIPVFPVTSAIVARAALADAVAEATLGKAVVLLLPMDAQVSSIVDTGQHSAQSDRRVPTMSPPIRGASLAPAMSLLEKSSRPLIVAGIGAHRAGARQAIESLAERIGALLATTLKAKDLFRGNPYHLGILGSSSHSTARRYIDQADCVLVFGASLNHLTMTGGKSLPPVPIIQVDRQRNSLGRWWYADVGIVGDACAVAEKLTAAVGARSADAKPFHTEETRRSLATFDQRTDFVPVGANDTVDPRLLALELSRLLPHRRTVVWDGGNFMANWAYVEVPDPDYLKITLDFGSVGLGLGTAMGMARARPDCPTVLFIGDGGLLMSLGELETIVREDLPVVVIVMNDAAYGAEVHILQAQNLSGDKATFADVSFETIGAALGFETATVRSLAALETLAPLLANPSGPILLDCKISVAAMAPFIGEFVAGKRE